MWEGGGVVLLEALARGERKREGDRKTACIVRPGGGVGTRQGSRGGWVWEVVGRRCGAGGAGKG